MFLLIESPVAYEYKILSESKTRDGYKVKLKAILQTVDEVNGNKRVYPKSLLQEAIQSQLQKIKNRQFVGELDHPIPIGNRQFDVVRQITPMYRYASHLITNVWIDGKYVMGEVETLSTPYGQTLTSLILDKVLVGFSSRAIGDVVQENGYLKVTKPFRLVTWDCVANPSHKEAVMVELQESAIVSALTDTVKTMKLVQDSGINYNDNYNLLYESNSSAALLNDKPDLSKIKVCANGICKTLSETLIDVEYDKVLGFWKSMVKTI